MATGADDPAADAPGDDADAGMEGNLGQVTDADWLAAHRQLIDAGALPAEETRFLFDPQRDPADVSPEDLTEDGQPRG